MRKRQAKLFVYGTLGPGRPNEHILGNIGGSWLEGSVCGSLHQEGWGAAMGYPGIVLDDNGDHIPGHVFCSDHLEEHWDELDRFEGAAYERVMTKVHLPDGTTVEAHIYVLKRLAGF